MTTTAQLDNLIYLRDTVIPHLEGMPSVEEFIAVRDNTSIPLKIRSVLSNALAVFSLDTFVSIGAFKNKDKISSTYDCGRHGCLAGWYTMMSRQDKRLDKRDREKLRNFSEHQLAIHFGIPNNQVTDLFDTLGDGCESRSAKFGAYGGTNHGALKIRKTRLKGIIAKARRALAESEKVG